ncbi:sac3 ganp nin1 mts3 eif-3 p25 [Pyrenophora seminiperda CCB06]|uniref:Sac3 ganp nin1 mts3 eif-3 p25 n=1 Tax=Pyrenophora seminiperda CCB06 TaxID=1302712 RepID=A0A3M7MAL4_9PLEO|nr:sac3 ganp nin1 mts3 eif-3 p25 [Pyrenophora seminiperda CCB06]
MKSSDPVRPSSRRAASGAWNRLKPVREDVLETYGLPSKGETRLNDFKTQEVYFNRIIERYMKLCALNREELDRLFASVSVPADSTAADTKANDTIKLTSSFSSLSLSKHAPPEHQATRQPLATTSTNTSTAHPIPQKAFAPSITELATVLASLRKLREAITASNRSDAFALRAYTFAIHVSILCHDWNSYLPSLLSLLNTIHPKNPLSPSSLHEFVGLLILDQACRQSDYSGARATKLAFGYKDWRVEKVLKCLVADDYVGFWRVRRAVDGYQRSVVEWADGGVRVHALKCLGKSYLSADRRFVERCTDRRWDELVEDGVGWELSADGDKVMIKKPKAA